MSSNEFIEVEQSSPSNDEGDAVKKQAENISTITETFVNAIDSARNAHDERESNLIEREESLQKHQQNLAEREAKSKEMDETLEQEKERLTKREGKLEEREVALQKAINGVELEKQLMAGRTPGDILELNVGGTKIMVKRSTLCQCEDSLLAAHFSGRWDDNVDKVEEAFFINQPPELFVALVDFLRLKEIETPSWPARLPRALEQSLNFWHLVDYYGMTSFVFPGTYLWKFSDFSKAEDDKVYDSHPFYIDGCKWKLEIQKRLDRHVTLSLHALGTDLPRQASVTLTICGSKRNVSEAKNKFNFSRNCPKCSWVFFMRTKEVSDANAGFLVNDTLTVEAKIEVHFPPMITD